MENSKLKEELEYMISISKMKDEKNIAINKRRKFINRSIGIVACACIVVISGITYAKDIETYFKSLFTNSTEAIDTAVENGYVQKEEMDFVYDKDIGVKVDNLVIDDLNLAISFSFETKNKDIKLIRFNDFTIANDNEKVIYRSVFKSEENIEDVPLYSSVMWNKPERTSDTTFTDSILISLKAETEEFKELLFNIKCLDITYLDDTKEELDGNWDFNVTISDEMKNSPKITYILLEESEYVKSATATLSPTKMFVELELKQPIDFETIINKVNNREVPLEMLFGFLLKYNNNTIIPSSRDGGEIIDSNGKINATAEYNEISSFDKEFSEFEIYIVPFDSTIKFVKEN